MSSGARLDAHRWEFKARFRRGAFGSTMKAAERDGSVAGTLKRIRELVARDASEGFVAGVLGREAGRGQPDGA